MSLLSCPSHSNGIRYAPAVAREIYREPETGELQAARWTFKDFPCNRNMPASVEISRGGRITRTDICDCSVQRKTLTFGEMLFFPVFLGVRLISNSSLCIQKRYWSRASLAHSTCGLTQRMKAGGNRRQNKYSFAAILRLTEVFQLFFPLLVKR